MTTLKPLIGTVLLLGGVVATLVLDRMDALGPMPVVVAQTAAPQFPMDVKPATAPVLTPAMRTELETAVAQITTAEDAFMTARERFNAVLGKYHVAGYRLNLSTLRYEVDRYYKAPPELTVKPKEEK